MIIGVRRRHQRRRLCGVGQTSAFSAEFDVTALFKFNGTTSVSGGYNVSAAGRRTTIFCSQHRINANAGDGHLIFGGENLAGVTVNQGTLGGLAVGAGGGFTISGEDSSDYAGRAMSSAGDFNGDGYDDILIGSPGNQSDPNYNGYSYVVFGGASLTSGSDINLANIDGTNGIKFIGVAYGDEAGYFVGSAGDVNGDGFDDIIVSAPDTDQTSLNNAGTAYIIYGGNFSGNILFHGTSAAETSVGTTADEIMIGGLGADTLTGGGGADVLRGGGDDDVLNVNDLTFLKVDGGGGTDTLGLDKAGAVIDLTTIANNKIQDIEVLDLNGTLNSTLTISAAEVLALSDTSNTIKIAGNIGDSVQTTDAGWVFTGDLGAPENGFDFHIFTNGAATMHVSHALTHQGIGDLPRIISIADVVVSEEAGFVTVTLSRSGDVSGTSTVDFSMTGGTATTGTDFTVSAGGINFLANSTSQTLNIAITDDAVFEAPETFAVNLSNAVNAVIVDDEATVTIVDRIDLDTLDGTNGFVIVGQESSSRSSAAVSGAGDVNGDGFADVIVGALPIRWRQRGSGLCSFRRQHAQRLRRPVDPE